ncbi:MAG: hypothetical protein PHZ09_05260 [Eubacteriales bacterium]|jgi:hypothetical protein|nr:hypothetical protein [Eubacteriales bacterium]
MKNNSVGKYTAFAVFGFMLLTAGLILAVSLPDAQNIMRTLPYIMIGIGSGIFGVNLGAAIQNHLLKKDPRAARQLEIETKDERNIAINTKAKAKAYDLGLMVFGALILAFALMRADIYIILILATAYLFVVFSMIYYISRNNKEM